MSRCVGLVFFDQVLHVRLSDTHPPGPIRQLFLNRHVAERNVIVLAGPDEGCGESGLEAGLVEAREGAPGVGRLELGGGDGHAIARTVPVQALVEAGDTEGQVATEFCPNRI